MATIFPGKNDVWSRDIIIIIMYSHVTCHVTNLHKICKLRKRYLTTFGHILLKIYLTYINMNFVVCVLSRDVKNMFFKY